MNKLEESLKEKDSIICKNNEKLTNELINRPQQVVNNSNTNYITFLIKSFRYLGMETYENCF
jgi:hypothetical protein